MMKAQESFLNSSRILFWFSNITML
uniref:Uncharacterized protein n=1 Tax=Anguilla anguilla TaxID=7936 RepID=A0A0E9TNX8_ANGAN